MLILLSFAAGAPSASVVAPWFSPLAASVPSLASSSVLSAAAASEIGLNLSAAARRLHALALWLLDPHLMHAVLELLGFGNLAGAHRGPVLGVRCEHAEVLSFILTGGSAMQWTMGGASPVLPSAALA